MRRNPKGILSGLVNSRWPEGASKQDDQTIMEDEEETPLLDDFDVSEGDAWSTNSC